MTRRARRRLIDRTRQALAELDESPVAAESVLDVARHFGASAKATDHQFTNAVSEAVDLLWYDEITGRNTRAML